MPCLWCFKTHGALLLCRLCWSRLDRWRASGYNHVLIMQSEGNVIFPRPIQTSDLFEMIARNHGAEGSVVLAHYPL